MNPLNFILYSLATWRISSLLVCEDGPADVFKRLRAAVCRSPFFSGLLSCVWCCSVWVGMAFALLGLDAPMVVRIAAGLSFSAAAVMIQRWMEVQERQLA
jgi:hypothetical protein